MSNLKRTSCSALASSLALFASLAALVGCGDDTGTGGSAADGGGGAGGDNSGGGGANGGGGAGDGGGGGTPTITLSGSFNIWPTSTALVGADVCWSDAGGDLCTTTDEDGQMVPIDVPAGADGAITVTGSEVFPVVLPMILGEADLDVFYGLDTIALIEDLYVDAGLVADPTLGIIAIQTSDTGGTTITLSPAGGWEGPFYIDASGVAFDLSATESSTLGLAYFMRVDPSAGPFTVQAASNGNACDLAEYGTSLPELPVFAGKQTHVRVHCNP